MSVSIRQKVKACFTLDKAPNPQVNVRRNGQVILEAHQALTFMQRLRGLHALPLLQGRQALLIRPCSSVHTFGLHYPIDVVYLDRDGVVLKALALEPRRGSVCHGAHTVVEMAQGRIQGLSLKTGQKLSMDGEPAT